MWVLLCAETKTIVGRYSSDEMIQKLYLGQASFQDYVWKEGYSQWQKICLVAELDPTKKDSNFINPHSSITHTSVNQFDTEELLNSVQKLDRSRTDRNSFVDGLGIDLVSQKLNKI